MAPFVCRLCKNRLAPFARPRHDTSHIRDLVCIQFAAARSALRSVAAAEDVVAACRSFLLGSRTGLPPPPLPRAFVLAVEATKRACKAAFFAVVAAADALALHVSLPAPHGFQYPGHAPLRPGLAAAFFACQAAVSAAVHASRAAALAANGAAYGVGETLRIRSLVAIGGVQYCHASAFIACRAAVSAAVHASRAAALAVGDAAACCPRWATPVLSSEWEEGEYGFEPTYLGTWEDDVASAIAESEVPSYMEAAQWDY